MLFCSNARRRFVKLSILTTHSVELTADVCVCTNFPFFSLVFQSAAGGGQARLARAIGLLPEGRSVPGRRQLRVPRVPGRLCEPCEGRGGGEESAAAGDRSPTPQGALLPEDGGEIQLAKSQNSGHANSSHARFCVRMILPVGGSFYENRPIFDAMVDTHLAPHTVCLDMVFFIVIGAPHGS